MPESHPHAEWSGKMFDLMREAGVKLFAHVPDAGNDRLIALAEENNDTRAILLTTEEEGVAVAPVRTSLANAVLCMQSSGLGNCPNYLSLTKARFPLLDDLHARRLRRAKPLAISHGGCRRAALGSNGRFDL